MEKIPNLKIEKFLSKIHEIYPDKFFEVEKYFYNYRPVTFRVNNLKLENNSAEQILNKLKDYGFEIENGPIKNSFICKLGKAEIKLSETEEFNNGLIYIQGLSSMFPVMLMNLEKGQNILDMCASPGSKTSQIAAELNNECFITAIENNKKRYYILKKNMETLGVKCVNAVYDNAVTLPLKYPDLLESFDRVLLDVPCSNEGSVYLQNPKSIEKWNSKIAKRLSKLQKTLLYSGISLLKPGGSLLYSTCTYSIEENEEVINWALNKFGNLKVEKINIDIENTVPGFTKWKEDVFEEQLANTIRIIPTDLFIGFYIAMLKKTI